MLKIVINLPPITKKNHQRILKNRRTGSNFIAQSPQYGQYEREAWYHIRKNRPELHINRPVTVQCVYYMPTHRRVDLVNLQEATLDVLVAANVLEDDNSNIVVSMDGSRVLYDKDNPRTEIFISDYF